MTARVKVDVRECVGVVCVGVWVCGCGVGVGVVCVWVWCVGVGVVCGCGCGVYLCHLIACWMVLDKAVGTYSI